MMPQEPDAYQYGDTLVSHTMLMVMPQHARNDFLRRLSTRHAETLKGRPAIEIALAVRGWGCPVWFDLGAK
jgi:hypothetical protein